jgi:hypothetical protein
MKAVFKYEIPVPKNNVDCETIVAMPLDARPHRVSWQNHRIYMWAEVEVDEGCKPVHEFLNSRFYVYPTGFPFDSKFKEFVGTVTMYPDHSLVWHVYRRGHDPQ